MAPQPTAQKPSIVVQIIAVVGAVIGAAIGRAAGLSLLIPFAGAFLVGVPLSFLTSGKARQMVPAGAVQAGHALWMIVGLLLLMGGAVPAMHAVNPLVLVEAVCFGKMLAAAVEPHSILLWDTTTGKLLNPSAGPPEQVMAAAFSQDGRFLATGGSTLSLREPTTGREVARLAADGSAQTFISSVAFASNGRWLATTDSQALSRAALAIFQPRKPE
jgi:hypothetical protein